MKKNSPFGRKQWCLWGENAPKEVLQGNEQGEGEISFRVVVGESRRLRMRHQLTSALEPHSVASLLHL
jgi:hypothetical protein